jgi:hypothetical protein
MNRRICVPAVIAAGIVIMFARVSADPPNPQGCSEGCMESHCVKIEGDCVLASRTTCWEFMWGVGAGGASFDNSEQVIFEVRQFCDKECTGKERSNATGCDGMKLNDYGSSLSL